VDVDRPNLRCSPKRLCASCNIVMTVDGKATIVGTAHGFVDQADHQAMQQVRLHADAILSGVGTPARPRTPPAPQS
jgi:riboflavin biosynthesis pyrimidine reductase